MRPVTLGEVSKEEILERAGKYEGGRTMQGPVTIVQICPSELGSHPRTS